MATVGSRDLSEIGGRDLEVTIEGVGSFGTLFPRPMSLAVHVAQCVVSLTDETVPVPNPACTPWRIVSFDREGKKLVVRPVKE